MPSSTVPLPREEPASRREAVTPDAAGVAPSGRSPRGAVKHRLDPPLLLITYPSIAHCLCCLCRFLPAKGRAREMPLQRREMRLLVKVQGQVVEEGGVKGVSPLSPPPSPPPPPNALYKAWQGALWLGFHRARGRAGVLAPSIRGPLVKDFPLKQGSGRRQSPGLTVSHMPKSLDEGAG